jgi:hypothetical protein
MVIGDWCTGSGSAIDVALEVPDVYGLAFDLFPPDDPRVQAMLRRWNVQGSPKRAAYVQCVAGRVPAVRDLRAIIRREFDLPLTALRILSGSPNCETLSTAPASHAFLARGGPPDYEPRSQRAIADDFARIAYMDLCEELAETIPREDPDALFTGIVENPYFGAIQQVRDMRLRLQFSRRGLWRVCRVDHCMVAAVTWPNKPTFYGFIGPGFLVDVRCSPGDRCPWSVRDSRSHRHALTITDYNADTPEQQRVPEGDIRRFAIPLRGYGMLYALVLKAQAERMRAAAEARRSVSFSAVSSSRSLEVPEVSTPCVQLDTGATVSVPDFAIVTPIPIHSESSRFMSPNELTPGGDGMRESAPAPSLQSVSATSRVSFDTSSFVRDALSSGLTDAGANTMCGRVPDRASPPCQPPPARPYHPVVILPDDDPAHQFRQHAAQLLHPDHPQYAQAVDVRSPAQIESVLQRSYQLFTSGKISLFKRPHPTARQLHEATLHTRPQVPIYCVKSWPGFCLTGPDGRLIPAAMIRLSDLEFDGVCHTCMFARTTAPPVRHTHHQRDQARSQSRPQSAPSRRVSPRLAVA